MSEGLYIRSFTESDFKKITQLADGRLGKDYLTAKELQTYVKKRNKIGIVALLNDKIVGFALAQLCDTKTLLEEVVDKREWFQETFKQAKYIGLFKTVAVDENYSGRGIGSALISYRMEAMRKKTNHLLVISWVRKQQSIIGHLFEKKGFTLRKQIDNYWKNDSIEKGYNCIVCGEPPCRCSAKVYIL